MRSAGEYPYTIDLMQPTDGQVDRFGHTPSTFKTVAQCAARVWTTSTNGATRDPGELTVYQPRLELLNPRSGIDVGWRLIWRGKIWNIEATEEREFNLVVTLSPVAA